METHSSLVNNAGMVRGREQIGGEQDVCLQRTRADQQTSVRA